MNRTAAPPRSETNLCPVCGPVVATASSRYCRRHSADLMAAVLGHADAATPAEPVGGRRRRAAAALAPSRARSAESYRRGRERRGACVAESGRSALQDRVDTVQNKLAAIVANAEVALDLIADGPARERVVALLDAAWQTSRLVSQLPGAAER